MAREQAGTAGMGEFELRLRVDAACQAQVRSRWALLAATVVSFGILIAEWNAYFSWDRRFLRVEDAVFDKKPMVSQHLHKEHVSGWDRGTRIGVTLLGVQYGVSDAPILGCISLMVLTVWFFFSMRRENHMIATLLSDICTHPDERMRRAAFFGIAGSLVFTTLSVGDEPIRHIPVRNEDNPDGPASVPRTILGILF